VFDIICPPKLVAGSQKLHLFGDLTVWPEGGWFSVHPVSRLVCWAVYRLSSTWAAGDTRAALSSRLSPAFVSAVPGPLQVQYVGECCQ